MGKSHLGPEILIPNEVHTPWFSRLSNSWQMEQIFRSRLIFSYSITSGSTFISGSVNSYILLPCTGAKRCKFPKLLLHRTPHRKFTVRCNMATSREVQYLAERTVRALNKYDLSIFTPSVWQQLESLLTRLF